MAKKTKDTSKFKHLLVADAELKRDEKNSGGTEKMQAAY